MEKKKLLVVDAVLLTVTVIWAFNFSIVKYVLTEMPPIGMNVLRFIISASIMAAYFHFTVGEYSFIKKHWKRLMFLALLGNTFLQLLFILGMNYTSASNASLMYSTVPIFVALLSVVYKIEKVKIISVIGIFVSFVGIFIVLSNSGQGVGFSKTTVTGDLLILVTALCWSTFTVFAKPLIEEISMLKVVAFSMVVGTIFFIPFGIPDFITMSWSDISMTSWMLLAFSAVFANVVGYLGWFYAVKHVGNVQTAIFQNLVPILAVVISAVFLKENITRFQIIGGVCIIAGVTITRVSAFVIGKINNRNGKNTE